MRRLVGVGVALVVVGAGCTSVKMVQRDGCWVRRTEKPFGRVFEEVGPCDRAEPRWAQDRLTRLIQECLAQADRRWHARALEVWSRGLPYPTPQPREDEFLRACMGEMRTGMETEADAARLKDRIGDLAGRVAELSGERDALRSDAARDHAKLQDREDKLAEWLGKSHDRVSDWLGQAAQKPPGNATASATSSSTSDGTATTDSGTTMSADAGASPAPAPVSSASVVLPPQGAAPAAPAAAAPAAAAPAAGPPPLAASTAVTAAQPPGATATPGDRGACASPPARREPSPQRPKRARRATPLVRPAASNAPAPDAPPCAVGAGPGAAPAETPGAVGSP
jgi:hypothetical protein